MLIEDRIERHGCGRTISGWIQRAAPRCLAPPAHGRLSAMWSRRPRSIAGLLLFIFLCAGPAFPISLASWPDAGPRLPVGTRIVWDSAAEGASGAVWYRYRVRGPSESAFRTVRDYSPDSHFVWSPIETDGTYEIETTALDLKTGETASTVSSYEIASRVEGGALTVTPTANELVFLLSAPPCQDGARTRAQMTSRDGARQFTHWLRCRDGRSVNVYLAGLRAATQYRVRQSTELPDGSRILSAAISFTTRKLTVSPAVSKPIVQAGNAERGVLVQSKPFDFTTAIDMQGNIIWYTTAAVRYLTRPAHGGYFLALNEDPKGGDADQTLRLIDLAGNTVFETNAAAINLQLERTGLHAMTSFHHEARMLSDGKILALAGTERVLTDVQGPGEVDVLGDMILVLSRDLQVEWAWDAFDHLDPARKAVLGETCRRGTGGCPLFRMAAVANDWLHGNALQLTPDGNILYSARHQDWVIKIDYSNGRGSGAVLWRMGKDGDFQFISDDPWPWFSHQHDANIAEASADIMAVFDNGNTRAWENSNAESRGQILRINEAQRTVTPVLNVKLGAYSVALGSAQFLDLGTYHFDLGWMPDGTSQAIEVDREGKVLSRIQTATQQYRSFRMRDMYSQ